MAQTPRLNCNFVQKCLVDIKWKQFSKRLRHKVLVVDKFDIDIEQVGTYYTYIGNIVTVEYKKFNFITLYVKN